MMIIIIIINKKKVQNRTNTQKYEASGLKNKTIQNNPLLTLNTGTVEQKG